MSDHAKYVDNVEKMLIPTFKPYVEYKNLVRLGRFTIQPIKLKHDVSCYGFMIKHEEMGKLVYITDTEYCKYTFKEVNHFLAEANYDETMIDKNAPNYEHVVKGHMSIQKTCEFLKANNNPLLENVFICHLSAENSSSDTFIKEVEKVVNCNVKIARKGMCENVTLIPFG